MGLRAFFIAFTAIFVILPVILYSAAYYSGFSFILVWMPSALVLSIIFYYYTNKKLKPLHKVIETLNKMSQGNFSFDFGQQVNGKDEISVIFRKISAVCAAVRELVGNLEGRTKTLHSSGEELDGIAKTSSHIASEVAITVEQLAIGANNQVGDITLCTDKVSEATQSSHGINDQIKEINSIAKEFVNIAGESEQSLNLTLEKIMDIKNSSRINAEQIDSLGKLAEEIDKIVEIITGISSRTNLLALNASIEAARAGEHGKGFSVVAEEVKKLAHQSSESALQIKDMVSKIQIGSVNAVSSTKINLEKIDEGVESFDMLKQNFERILNSSQLIDGKANTIYTSIEELVKKNDQVLEAMNSISGVTESNAAAAQEISASTEEHSAGTQELEKHSSDLLLIARDINVNTSVFKIDDKPCIFFWSKKFFTGITVVEYQHFKIVNLINEVYRQYLEKASPQIMLTTLKDLFDVATDHFAVEESYMKELGYPKYPQHQAIHQNLLSHMQKLLDSIENGTSVVDDKLIEFLNSWLSNHILQEDMQYAPFFKSKGLK